jgi:hypothetical protein
MLLAAAIFGCGRVGYDALDRDPACQRFVSPAGDDANIGTLAAPLATMAGAVAALPDQTGCEVVFLDGTYPGTQALSRAFANPITVRAATPLGARLVSSPNRHRVLEVYGAANVTVRDFEMAGAPGPADEYLVHVSLDTAGVTLAGNVIHDGWINDTIKINVGVRDMRVVGNVFYNRAPDPGVSHLDVDSIYELDLDDNVFFDDYAASGRPVPGSGQGGGPFVNIVNSRTPSRGYHIRRNLFLHWSGQLDQGYLRLGGDGNPIYEIIGAVVENNLFVGDTANPTLGALAALGVQDVTFQANTLHGVLPLSDDSYGLAGRLGHEGSEPIDDGFFAWNNIFSSPGGTMTHLMGGSDADLSANRALAGNLYFNGGQPLPTDVGRALAFPADAAPLVGDPGLAASGALLTLSPPHWDPASSAFSDGSPSIAALRQALVARWGTPAAGFPGAGRADPAHLPPDDILGEPRDAAAGDVGARQISP